MDKVCKNCGIIMTRRGKERPRDLKKRKYCSKECYKKIARYDRNVKNYSGQKINGIYLVRKEDSPKSPMVKYVCICHCGKEFLTRYHRLADGSTSSCGCHKSEKLREAARARIGPLSGRWNPEITDEDRKARLVRTFDEGAYWRGQVYKRDGRVCKICKTTKGILQGHHLDGWHWCKERRLDISNGVILCKECHLEFHKVYGNSHNTSEEFFEFYLVKTSTINAEKEE